MQIFDHLRLKFESPIWAKASQFAVIDILLENRPDIVELVRDDVIKDLKNNNMGRGDSPTVEQILRAAIYKELKGQNYQALEFDQYDSTICREFLHLNRAFSDSTLQSYISKISSQKINEIMIEINKIANELGYEDFKDIRTDTTPVETDVHRPTNNSLVYDCIKTATIFFEKMKETYAPKYEEVEKKRQEAKKLNYKLNNVNGKKNETQSQKENRAEKMKELFTGYLDLHQSIHDEVGSLIESGMEDFNQRDKDRIINLEKNMSIVYTNAYRFQIEGKKVENEDKIFSIYEEHTNIIVKGIRDVVFGHKINLSTGRSNLILYCNVEDGNPSDKHLFKTPILEIEKNYGVEKFNSSSTDGGYASLENLNFAKEKFVNVVFTKIVGSLQSIVENETIGNELKKWRAGIEANISNLKRKFNLKRVVWKGKKRFDAKIFWSVLAYNIRVLTGHILNTLKTI
ncbi:MAG: transposase [Bacteroidales bacterium]|nr:transposase [Bacteroidales bacterium]